MPPSTCAVPQIVVDRTGDRSGRHVLPQTHDDALHDGDQPRADVGNDRVVDVGRRPPQGRRRLMASKTADAVAWCASGSTGARFVVLLPSCALIVCMRSSIRSHSGGARGGPSSVSRMSAATACRAPGLRPCALRCDGGWRRQYGRRGCALTAPWAVACTDAGRSAQLRMMTAAVEVERLRFRSRRSTRSLYRHCAERLSSTNRRHSPCRDRVVRARHRLRPCRSTARCAGCG